MSAGFARCAVPARGTMCGAMSEPRLLRRCTAQRAVFHHHGGSATCEERHPYQEQYSLDPRQTMDEYIQ